MIATSLCVSQCCCNMANSKPVSHDAPAESTSSSAWAWIQTGLPDTERRQCQHSLTRAMLCGQGQELWESAVQEFRQLRADLQHAGAWDQVVFFHRKRLEMPQAVVPADAGERTKRMNDEELIRAFVTEGMEEDYGYLVVPPPEPVEVPTGPRRPLPTTSPSRTSTISAGTMSTVAKTMPTTRPQTMMASTTATPFPPGIQSLSQWGTTLIEFGKFKNQNMSYLAVAESMDDDVKTYRQWVVTRRTSTSGQCKDLGNYLAMMAEAGRLDEGAVIPGTSVNRRFVVQDGQGTP